MAFSTEEIKTAKKKNLKKCSSCLVLMELSKQNASDQQNNEPRRLEMKGNGHSHSLLVGVYTAAATLEIRVENSLKIKNKSTI